MIRRMVAIVGLAVAIAACGSAGKVLEADVDPADSKGTDLVTGDVTRLDAMADEQVEETRGRFGDLVDWAEQDGSPDSTGLACQPGEGCFGDHCLENGDCQSSWCVEHLGDGTCTQHCVEECPPGWTCKSVGAAGPDVEFICVSNYANLCKPCGGNEDCVGPAGTQDTCVQYGDEGSFCGGVCDTDEDCPWGFSCLESTSRDGTATMQCVADAGVCPCAARSVDLGLSTPCEDSNDFGTCSGQRVCTEDGLTACDAAVAGQEICNGLDDDCDGDVDEPPLDGGEFANLCDDGNECTVDTCTGETGCTNVPDHGAECKDGDPCTVADQCDNEVCLGTPVQCHDENPCTDDSCDETGGCIFQPNADDCDDGNPCTVKDTCVEGTCTGYELACDCLVDADCLALEDDNLCNGTLVCDLGQLPHKCVVDPATVVECDPAEDFCLAAQCDPDTGLCTFVAANQGAPCDDDNPCTVAETCSDGECTGGQATNCNDGNVCTSDTCDPDSGCVHTPVDGTCDDLDPCTVGDHCVAAACQAGQAMQCDDGNPCTSDSCDPTVGCLHQAVAGACDDGNACTSGDACVDGKCLFAQVVDCDDDNVCTDDTCDPAAGCQSTLNTAPCNDGDLCTLNDTCQLGACVGSGLLDCDDSNLCTNDSCNPVAGCEHLPNELPCSDNNLCTDGDLCSGGSCLGGAAKDCSDANPCTLDFCLWDQGCQHANLPDGAACETADVCLGTCQAGACFEQAVEVCDGEDNTCDGQVDEGFDDLDDDGQADCVDPDDDGDGSLDEDDCEPLNAAVHPAAEEICGNGIDEDCSGGDKPDSDGDGVCDDVDACPGGDDTVDLDENGIPDACEGCSDADNDGICDEDDVCPGGGDDVDANGDLIPDSCPINVLLVDGYGREDTQAQLQQWGFTVTVINGSNLGSGYNYEPFDVVAFMYNSSLDNAANLAAQNAQGKVGVLVHRGDNIVGPMDLGPSGFYQSETFAITDNAHFISSVFAVGPLPLSYTYKSRLQSISPNARTLGTASLPSLVVHKTLRRVLTPYYGHTSGMPWNNDAARLTWRSYMWAAGVGAQ